MVFELTQDGNVGWGMDGYGFYMCLSMFIRSIMEFTMFTSRESSSCLRRRTWNFCASSSSDRPASGLGRPDTNPAVRIGCKVGTWMDIHGHCGVVHRSRLKKNISTPDCKDFFVATQALVLHPSQVVKHHDDLNEQERSKFSEEISWFHAVWIPDSIHKVSHWLTDIVHSQLCPRSQISSLILHKASYVDESGGSVESLQHPDCQHQILLHRWYESVDLCRRFQPLGYHTPPAFFATRYRWNKRRPPQFRCPFLDVQHCRCVSRSPPTGMAPGKAARRNLVCETSCETCFFFLVLMKSSDSVSIQFQRVWP